MGKDAKVTIFVPEGKDLKVAGNGVTMVRSGDPSQLTIYGTPVANSSQIIKVAGNGQVSAVVYAPNSSVELLGGGNVGKFLGAVVGNDVRMTGGCEFYFDVALKQSLASDETNEIVGAFHRLLGGSVQSQGPLSLLIFQVSMTTRKAPSGKGGAFRLRCRRILGLAGGICSANGHAISIAVNNIFSVRHGPVN